MRIILRFTRFLIAAASSLHISGLRGSVYLDDRKVAKAMRNTDLAAAVVDRARADLALAKADHRTASIAEGDTTAANIAFRAAAQAEARQLRRDVTL